jgi:hypothetical protein
MEERKISKNLIISIVIAIAAIIALVINYEPGCGESNYCNSIQGGGVAEGYVHIGPTCPVIREGSDEECSDRPYSVSIEIHYPNEKLYKVIKSQEDGKFSVTLRSGEYIFRPQVANVLPACEEERVIVLENSTVILDISCDSGIR